MVPLSKSGVAQVTVGSNPTLSATSEFRVQRSEFRVAPPRSGATRRNQEPETRNPESGRGEVLEWPIRLAWRASREQSLVGSNPTLSATLVNTEAAPAAFGDVHRDIGVAQ